MGRLQLARHIAKQNIEEAMEKAKENYDKKVVQYKFKINQQVLLDEHYYLNRNQKISPKFTGPHIITKIKGDCNVELLLDNGKNAIVHVNRLKPYNSFENMGQNFSKAERGWDNDDLEVTDEFLTNNPDPPCDTQERPTNLGHSENKRLTRRQVQEQGMIYNDELKIFENVNPSEAIEALRRKNNKSVIHRKIKETKNYYIVEDVYYQVGLFENPKPPPKEEKAEPSIIKEEILEPYIKSPTPPLEIEIEEVIKAPEIDQTFRLSPAKFEIPARHIAFKTEPQTFFIPNSPVNIEKPKSKPFQFTRQILKEAADAIIPPPKASSHDDRPVKTVKSYSDLIPGKPIPTGTIPKNVNPHRGQRELPPPLDRTFTLETPSAIPTPSETPGREDDPPSQNTRSRRTVEDPP